MNKDFIKVKGWVTLCSYYFIDNDKTYLEKIEERTQNNLVTNEGKIFFAKKIINELSDIVISKIGMGLEDDPALVTDTELGQQFFEKEITSITTADNGNKNIIKFRTAILTGEGQGSIKELGLFTSNNIMVCRIVLDVPFIKITDEILTIEWSLQIGDSI